MKNKGKPLRQEDAAEVHRFVRRLPHSPEEVFRALTDESELAQWFPATVEGPRQEGSELRIRERKAGAAPEKGLVHVFEPPARFAYTWRDQTLNWELSRAPGGCVLVLTVTKLSRTPSRGALDPIAMAA